MTGRATAERAQNQALIAARRKEQDQQADSAAGMLSTAAQLRHSAGGMIDSNDRDAMIRVAVGYEQRAAGALGRLNRSHQRHADGSD